MRRIDELHLALPFMRARLLRRQLQRQDVHVGRRHIATMYHRREGDQTAGQRGDVVPTQPTRAHERLRQVQLVDAAHQVQLGRAGRARQADHRTAADARPLGLTPGVSTDRAVQICGTTSHVDGPAVCAGADAHV